jgi:hypothetical protein
MSAFATLICIVAAISVASRGDLLMALLPLAIVFGGFLFIIRGYTITSEALLVHRLFWTTRMPLTELRTAYVEPRAMRWAVRTFGNGGLFSFSGWHYNTLLGSYRAFVTDPSVAVVLHLGRSNVVVSPENPGDFVRDVLAITHTVLPREGADRERPI